MKKIVLLDCLAKLHHTSIPMLDDKYDLMRHPNIRLTEDGGAAPYDYTLVKSAADDLDYSPERYDEFELLDLDDFMKSQINTH